MLENINNWFTHWEPIWLFLILFAELIYANRTYYWVKKEYEYDESKDLEKKQRKTRTTKKVTESKDGGKVVEETTETSEPIKEDTNGHNS